MNSKNYLISNIIPMRLARFTLAILMFSALHSALADEITAPLLWAPQHHVEKPNTNNLSVIRFITDDTYPPFGFTQSDGQLTGFNVDMARAICAELQIPCTIQARRWDNLIPALDQGQGDAVIASLAITPTLRERVDFTAPYYKTPARFSVRTSSSPDDVTPERLQGQTIGVVSHSAHEAYLHNYFARSTLRTFDTLNALYSALKHGEIDIIFADGVSSSLWLAGSDAHQCCRFASGPYLESHYFSEGAGIAVKKGNVTLRRALDYALAQLAAKGIYKELYVRYFPISFF
jgi:polar amino acid transport system substrate-binding protein